MTLPNDLQTFVSTVASDSLNDGYFVASDALALDYTEKQIDFLYGQKDIWDGSPTDDEKLQTILAIAGYVTLSTFDETVAEQIKDAWEASWLNPKNQ